MRALPLSTSTQAILDRIRSYPWTLNVYGMSQSRAARLVKARTDTRLNKAGITPPYNNIYRRYVLELVKTFRTRTGEELARAIPLAIRKWSNLGLDVPLLEDLLGDCFLRFEQQGYALPKRGLPPLSAEENGGCTRPRRGAHAHPVASRRHGTYAEALRKGRAALRGGNTLEEQAELQQVGSARAAAIARRLKPLLAERGITGRGIIPYFNFAQQLGCLSRKYADRSLQLAASDLIDLYEAKSLDGDTLVAIAASLFATRLPA